MEREIKIPRNPPRATAQNPLVGEEQKVLEVWLSVSPRLRKLHAKGGRSRINVETAARLAWVANHERELSHVADSL